VPKRSKSSNRWLREHFEDPHVRAAQAAGYRSRAVFKLQALDRRYGLLRPGLVVLDLGAAPGAWSQYAARRVAPGGRVLASDILAFEPIAGVQAVIGDFTEAAVAERIRAQFAARPADLVISDLAPNISGQRAVDQPRAMYLAELALDMAGDVLGEPGCFVTKLFQGAGFEAYVQRLRAGFTRVVVRKPDASRARSSETYALAWGRKL